MHRTFLKRSLTFMLALLWFGIGTVSAEKSTSSSQATENTTMSAEFTTEKTYAGYLEQYADASRPDAKIELDMMTAEGTGLEVRSVQDGENKINALYTGESSTANWRFTVDTAGLYQIHLRYHTQETKGAWIERLLHINGALPYKEMSGLSFSRVWEDAPNTYTIKEDGNKVFCIVPPSTYISAWYMQFRHFDPFGLTTLITGNDSVINSFIPFLLRALTGQGLKNGLFIYLMVQYFRNMPHELEEAAKVDGAGALKTFIRIALPNSRPILLTVAVLSVVWQWNDDFFPSFLAPNLDFLTTNVSNIELMLFGSDAAASFAKDPPILSAAKNAAALLLSFPLILFFAVIQRFFTDSLERSGIVG